MQFNVNECCIVTKLQTTTNYSIIPETNYYYWKLTLKLLLLANITCKIYLISNWNLPITTSAEKPNYEKENKK